MVATLKFDDGAVQFRQRLAVSLLSNRPVLIRNIRVDDLEAPGLREEEASFLRLLDKLTNGSTIEINATGTQLRFKPGVILGGEISHDCPASRNVGWFLEGILPLAPFGKFPLELSLNGVTEGNVDRDPSCDYMKASIIPIMTKFGVHDDDEGPPVSLRITSRSTSSFGSVEFYCPRIKEVSPIDFTDEGKIKRIRGTAVSTRLPPTATARVAHASKGVLHRLLPDVWIHTDAVSSKKNNNNKSGPSLSLTLTAESTTGVVLSSETCLNAQQRGKELPEDVGVRGATMLLEEVKRGGCVDTSSQSVVLLWMCLGPEDVARIRMGTLSQYTIASLRLFKQAFGVEFKVRPDHDTKTVLLSCLGTGYRNMARAST